jgi:hypothetical protein
MSTREEANTAFETFLAAFPEGVRPTGAGVIKQENNWIIFYNPAKKPAFFDQLPTGEIKGVKIVCEIGNAPTLDGARVREANTLSL